MVLFGIILPKKANLVQMRQPWSIILAHPVTPGRGEGGGPKRLAGGGRPNGTWRRGAADSSLIKRH